MLRIRPALSGTRWRAGTRKPDPAQHHREPHAERDQQGQSEGDAAERDGGQQQNERRRARNQSAARAERDQAADAHFIRDVGVHASIAVMVREPRNRDASDRAPVKQRRSHPYDGDPGDRAENRRDRLRQHEARKVECDQSERQDADRVGEGHHQSEENGMTRRAARADQVGRDQRLAVARRERVYRAERECRQHAEQHHAPADVALPEKTGEIIALSTHYNSPYDYMRTVITAQTCRRTGSCAFRWERL